MHPVPKMREEHCGEAAQKAERATRAAQRERKQAKPSARSHVMPRGFEAYGIIIFESAQLAQANAELSAAQISFAAVSSTNVHRRLRRTENCSGAIKPVRHEDGMRRACDDPSSRYSIERNRGQILDLSRTDDEMRNTTKTAKPLPSVHFHRVKVEVPKAIRDLATAVPRCCFACLYYLPSRGYIFPASKGSCRGATAPSRVDERCPDCPRVVPKQHAFDDR